MRTAGNSVFPEYGFLSDQAERERRSKTSEGFPSSDKVKQAVKEALEQLVGLNSQNLGPTDWHALAYWLRCLEAVQGATLLADFGMRGTAASALRTAYECLFVACAIWRDPAVAECLGPYSAKERRKMADGLSRSFDRDAFPPDIWQDIDSANSSSGPEADVNAFDMAQKADLRQMYAMQYRGFSAIGTHPNEASLKQFRPVVEESGRWRVDVGPNFVGAGALMLQGVECLETGILRLRERFKCGEQPNQERSPEFPAHPPN